MQEIHDNADKLIPFDIAFELLGAWFEREIVVCSHELPHVSVGQIDGVFVLEVMCKPRIFPQKPSTYGLFFDEDARRVVASGAGKTEVGGPWTKNEGVGKGDANIAGGAEPAHAVVIAGDKSVDDLG